MIPDAQNDYAGEGKQFMTSSYRGQPNIMAFLQAALAECQTLESVLWDILQKRRLIWSNGETTVTAANAQLDARGALLVQPRPADASQPNLLMDDADYLTILLLRVACRKSNGSTTAWSRIAAVLLTFVSSVLYREGNASIEIVVDNITRDPNVTAQVLGDAVPNGVRADLVYTTWADTGKNFKWASIYDATAGQGGWGSVYDGTAGGLLAACAEVAT